MTIIKQSIHCPNCGSFAEREYLASTHLIRTQCPTCDYLMIMCSRTNKVIEAYAPGISVNLCSQPKSCPNEKTL